MKRAMFSLGTSLSAPRGEAPPAGRRHTTRPRVCPAAAAAGLGYSGTSGALHLSAAIILPRSSRRPPCLAAARPALRAAARIALRAGARL